MKSELLMSRSRLSLFSPSVRSDATLTNRSKNTPKNIWELRTSCRFIKHLLLFDADDYALMIDYTVYLKFLSFHLRRQKEETRTVINVNCMSFTVEFIDGLLNQLLKGLEDI